MALTYSADLDTNFTCPDFELPTTSGAVITSKQLKQSGRPFLVSFICNHCPYVQAIENRLVALGYVLKALDIPMVAISSNDATKYPEDSFENMKKKNYPFPYAYDETQEVAKAFGALCTPEFYLFNSEGKLRYRGRLDDNWKDASQVKRQELLEATIALLKSPELNLSFPIQHSMGCSIKWKG